MSGRTDALPTGRPRIAALAGAAAIVAGVALAGGADAATISGDVGTDPPFNGCTAGTPCPPNTMTYTAAAGELNDLTVTRDTSGSSPRYTFTETGSVNITAPQGGCTTLNAHSVSCTFLGGLVSIGLGDQADRAHINGNVNVGSACGLSAGDLVPAHNCFSVDGGAGADILDAATTGASGVTLNGGEDADTLTGGSGPDVLAGGPAADQINGGAGLDIASYAGYTAAVTVTLDGVANDGAPGIDGGTTAGGDAVAANVEGAEGGKGNDTLRGNNGPNQLFGDGGTDLLAASGGNDLLEGGTEPDTFGGGSGIDTVSYADHVFSSTIVKKGGAIATLDGRANDGVPGLDGGGTNNGVDDIRTDVENLEGSNGSDTLVGNSDRNMLVGDPASAVSSGLGTGNDKLTALDGDDFIDANDGVADGVACGAGADKATVDLHDGPAGFPDCETAAQAAVDQHPTVEIHGHSLRLRSGDGGSSVVAVRLKCPRAIHGGCEGKLTISRTHGAKIGSASYRIAAGHSGTVDVEVKPGVADTLEHGGATEVRVAAHEKDANGERKLSLRTMKLTG